MTMFSIIIPLFNKEYFIEATLDSVLSQNYLNFEVLIINDGSTDNSLFIANGVDDDRVHIFTQENSGVSIARNRGIDRARGKFVCFLDADDFWAPDHLENILNLIHEDPKAVGWATGYTDIEEHAGLTTQINVNNYYTTGSKRFDHHDFLRQWSIAPFFWTGSITVRATTLRRLQPCFPPSERLGEDQDLWFRLSELGHIRFVDIRSTAYYRRNVSDSLTSALVLEPLPALIRLMARESSKTPRELIAARHLFNIHLLHVAWNNCLAGKRKVAFGFLLRAGPSAHWAYWFRIFFCLCLPLNVVRYTMTALRRIGTNSL